MIRELPVVGIHTDVIDDPDRVFINAVMHADLAWCQDYSRNDVGK